MAILSHKWLYLASLKKIDKSLGRCPIWGGGKLARAAALQSGAVRRSTGNDVSGHYFRRYFLFFFFFFSPSSTFLIEGSRIRSKNFLSESGSKQPNTQGYTPFQNPSTILGPMAAILDYEGGERVPPTTLYWYFQLFLPIFTYFHLCSLFSPIFIYFYLFLPFFTFFYLLSPILTYVDLF